MYSKLFGVTQKEGGQGRQRLRWRFQSCLEFVGQGFIIIICIDVNICYPAGESSRRGLFPHVQPLLRAKLFSDIERSWLHARENAREIKIE